MHIRKYKNINQRHQIINEKYIEKNCVCQQNGITLIALVVTIVIIIILAGITLSLALNDQGTIQKTEEAGDAWRQGEQNDQEAINGSSNWLRNSLAEINEITNQTSNNKRLPHEYQEVEYIKSLNSNCSINTAMIPTLNFEYEFIYEVTETVSSNIYFLGTNASTSRPRLNIRYNSSDSFTAFTQTSEGEALTIGSYSKALNTKIDVVCKGDDDNQTIKLIVDGAQVAEKTTYKPNVEFKDPIRFFNYYSDSNVGLAGLKVYYFKLINNGVLVREMIPCYRKSDNEIGMYDLVNNVFYTNQGTGTFLKGADI